MNYSASREIHSYFDDAILEISKELQTLFARKTWKSVPIFEQIGETPKELSVVPNIDIAGKAMAWPAYYKATKSDSQTKGGFGEIAETMDQQLQLSPVVLVRPEVLLMLDEVQKLLDSTHTTKELKLVVVDGYRKLEVQDALFSAYTSYYQDRHPLLSRLDVEDQAQKMVAIAPKDPEILKTSPPPHATGGSVDVILVDKKSINISNDHWLREAMIDFGADFDEMMHKEYGDERSATRYFELHPSNKVALQNRRLLYNIMTEVGFTNIPSEWWHFDFGNQQHAAVNHLSSAQFGFAAGIKNGKVIEDARPEQEAFEIYLQNHKVLPEEIHHIATYFGLKYNHE